MNKLICAALLLAALPASAPAQPLGEAGIPPGEAPPPSTREVYDDETELNRSVIERFANMFWIEKNVREAFTNFVAPDYIQHNPLAPDGRDNAIELLGGYFAASPSLDYDIERIIVDGNMAAVHTHMRMASDDRGSAVVDLFRLENGMIVEHWDVIQAVPSESANDHPMF